MDKKDGQESFKREGVSEINTSGRFFVVSVDVLMFKDGREPCLSTKKTFFVMHG
jgi:hypothetical protein